MSMARLGAHETEARAILAVDPYIKMDVVSVVELREWVPMLTSQ